MSNTNEPTTFNKQILQTTQTWDDINYHRYPALRSLAWDVQAYVPEGLNDGSLARSAWKAG